MVDSGLEGVDFLVVTLLTGLLELFLIGQGLLQLPLGLLGLVLTGLDLDLGLGLGRLQLGKELNNQSQLGQELNSQSQLGQELNSQSQLGQQVESDMLTVTRVRVVLPQRVSAVV